MDDWTDDLDDEWDDDSHGSFEGDVYYDPKIDRFLQLRERHDDHLVFGEHCGFYNDAKTTIIINAYPLAYLEELEKVADVEKFEKAERDPRIGTWRVKGYLLY